MYLRDISLGRDCSGLSLNEYVKLKWGRIGSLIIKNKFQLKIKDKIFSVHLKNVSRVCLGLFDFIFFDAECFVIGPDLEWKKKHTHTQLKFRKRLKNFFLQIIDFEKFCLI